MKSLDPSVTSLRETVHEAATVILNELVRTYPSIDFHHSSQRLAVGTPEGATIIYDLRTGTRLYVLEGHSKSITALSWSPDGRRLVSVSLEESKVLVWKIGVGLLSMFAGGLGVGGEGRGVDGKVPWKVLDFNVGDEGKKILLPAACACFLRADHIFTPVRFDDYCSYIGMGNLRMASRKNHEIKD